MKGEESGTWRARRTRLVPNIYQCLAGISRPCLRAYYARVLILYGFYRLSQLVIYSQRSVVYLVHHRAQKVSRSSYPQSLLLLRLLLPRTLLHRHKNHDNDNEDSSSLYTT